MILPPYMSPMVLPLDTEPLLWNAAKINSTQKEKRGETNRYCCLWYPGFHISHSPEQKQSESKWETKHWNVLPVLLWLDLHPVMPQAHHLKPLSILNCKDKWCHWKSFTMYLWCICKLHMHYCLSTTELWTTWICTEQVHWYADFFPPVNTLLHDLGVGWIHTRPRHQSSVNTKGRLDVHSWLHGGVEAPKCHVV